MNVKDLLLWERVSSSGSRQIAKEKHKHIGEWFSEVFLVSGSLEPGSTQSPNNAFMPRGTQQSLIILFSCVLEPSELLAPTAPCRREFPGRGDDLCLAGSLVVSLLCLLVLVLKQLLVLLVLVQEEAVNTHSLTSTYPSCFGFFFYVPQTVSTADIKPCSGFLFFVPCSRMSLILLVTFVFLYCFHFSYATLSY